jgi:signal transduction histidine kinase
VIAATITLLLLGALMISILFLYRSRHRKHLREKEQMRLSYERELFKTQLEIQEQTFRHISQEIHDNIGQMLSLTKLNLATMDTSQPSILQQKIHDSKNLVGQAIHDLRHLSHGLSTDYLADLGLVRSIENELEMIRKSGHYETVFDLQGTPYSLEKQSELIIYRILQESLNNIIKHAACQKIIIHLRYQPDEFTLGIEDDGKGFDCNALTSNSSFGLGIKNMYNRARLIGAGFQVSSTIEEGTSVMLRLPFGDATT